MEKLLDLYSREPAVINGFIATMLNVVTLLAPITPELKGSLMSVITAGLAVLTRMRVDSTATSLAKTRELTALKMSAAKLVDGFTMGDGVFDVELADE